MESVRSTECRTSVVAHSVASAGRDIHTQGPSGMRKFEILIKNKISDVYQAPTGILSSVLLSVYLQYFIHPDPANADRAPGRAVWRVSGQEPRLKGESPDSSVTQHTTRREDHKPQPEPLF